LIVINSLQYTPTQLILRDEKTNTENKVTVKLKFIPIKMTLDPSESYRNMGTLHVDVLSASNLPAADRNGYSDPYIKFKLNDTKVHETDKKKKTLNPVYNEKFEVAIRSRTTCKFIADVWDWDLADSDDFLGKVVVDLNDLEPFQRKQVDLPLEGKSGTLKLGLMFSPQYITRTRQGSSTFHGTISGAGKIAGAPVKTIGKVGGTVGGGVVKTGSFLGKTFRRRKSRTGSEMEETEEIGTPEGRETPPPGSVIQSIEGPADGAVAGAAVGGLSGSPTQQGGRIASSSRLSISGASLNGASPGGGPETGTANITILSASGFPPKANVRVHVYLESGKHSGREVHKTKPHKSSSGEVKFDGNSESFRVPCAADSPFKVVVKDNHTFGHDDELGEAHFFVADQGSGAEQTLRMTKGDGKVVVRSAFVPLDQASINSSGPNKLSRFGVGTLRRDRSATPGV
jgi:C2 domain-containing protein